MLVKDCSRFFVCELDMEPHICHQECYLLSFEELFVSTITKPPEVKVNKFFCVCEGDVSMTSHVVWPFLTYLPTYLPTYLVLLFNVPFWGLSLTPLPTLIWDVINERYPIILKSLKSHLNRIHVCFLLSVAYKTFITKCST